MRRRGCPPEAIRDFIARVGVAKSENLVDISLLEYCVRQNLNKTAPRVMAILRPLKVVVDNYPEDKVEDLDADNNPEDVSMGTRKIPFSQVIYIEEEDFMEKPSKKYFRLAPGREVRLKHAYYITCVDVVKDEQSGEVVELHCTYDPASRGGWTPDERKVRGTLHWVSAAHALEAEIRLYDRLFTKPDPDDVEEGSDFRANLNPNSLEVLTGCQVEPSLAGVEPGSRYQFLRKGYFCIDPDSTNGKLVFNQTVPLRDTWAKIQKAQEK
jgi:glutaminyl-tRNA synthetase